jgi:hypothetical protein
LADTDIKLDFAIVGVQKAGTSALFNYLRQHSQIALGDTKELRFFDKEINYQIGKPDYSILHNMLPAYTAGKLRGDCTPNYMYWEPSMQRIWEYNPNIKIIAVLRNPVDRAFSEWNMFKVEGKVNVDFETYLKDENVLRQADLPFQPRFFAAIGRSLYAEQIKRVYKYFSKEQVLFIKYENYKADQVKWLNEIFRFLGVDEKLFQFNEAKVFAIDYIRSMTDEEKLHLQNVFTADIKEVENLLGWNCDDWKA